MLMEVMRRGASRPWVRRCLRVNGRGEVTMLRMAEQTGVHKMNGLVKEALQRERWDLMT